MNREVLDRYREAIVQAAEAEKALIDCRARLAIIEKEIELSGKASDTPPKTMTERFIDDNRDKLEPDDIEFLSEKHRGAKEVVRYSGISESTLRRMVDAEKIEARRTDAGHRRYNTVSVVRYLITERDGPSA
ncbi:MAG: MerR family DNA-binding transcriptional regulator [Rhodopirellula sp. JB055]|uniref:MerR family DNA-binding transcriptional regulator n=1 Tax=Rhodopirellula sp. JB055 TaxID=3342846 RepID=UPI00370C7034